MKFENATSHHKNSTRKQQFQPKNSTVVNSSTNVHTLSEILENSSINDNGNGTQYISFQNQSKSNSEIVTNSESSDEVQYKTPLRQNTNGFNLRETTDERNNKSSIKTLLLKYII